MPPIADADPPKASVMKEVHTSLVDALKATLREASAMTDIKARAEVLALCAQAFASIDVAMTERIKARFQQR